MTDPRNASTGAPPWWIVCRRETKDLWVGGKALYLILIYMVLLGIYSYTLAGNAEVKLLPIREMISEMVKHSIALGLFICTIVAADTFSGERERGTLETMLLTSASRRQMVLGKFVACMTAWVVAMMVAIPYWIVLAKGDPVLVQSLRWGVPLGTVLALGMTALAMLVSLWCTSNKTSMMASLCLFLLVLLPSELSRPGIVQSAAEVRKTMLYSAVNPWAAGSNFLVKTLAQQVALADVWYLLVFCAAFVMVMLTVLLGFVGGRVRLEPQIARNLRLRWARWRSPERPTPRPATARPRAESTGREVQLAPIVKRVPRHIERRPQLTKPSAPTWWVVFKKELGDLWVGGKALYLTIGYTVVLGIYTWVTARDSTISLVPPKEMVFELTKAALIASQFVSLIIGADSLSGERERATLEGLLLTPTSRVQIVVGKFLAAASPGPAALLITIPYMRVLSQGDEVFGQAVAWALGLGCMLTLAFTALSMFVGFWCSSNKTSLFVSLCLYIVFLLPSQLTGHAQGGTMGLLFQAANPLQAPRFFLAAILVNNWTMDRAWSWLVSPLLFALLTFGLLFWYASPALRLEAGTTRRMKLTGAKAALLICAVLAFSAGPLLALQGQAPPSTPARAPLSMSIDAETKDVRAGTPIEYHTVLTNGGSDATAPMIVAMNIVNLSKTGDVVDPEDWSPQRTQYVDPIPAGQTATLAWRINAILDGNYMVYMVAIPAPSGPNATSHPVASPGIHLMVSKYTRLNPGGVLPYAIGGPVVLGLVIFAVYRRRHREIDAGGGD
jgi:ABC-2 type transport system permease protein